MKVSDPTPEKADQLDQRLTHKADTSAKSKKYVNIFWSVVLAALLSYGLYEMYTEHDRYNSDIEAVSNAINTIDLSSVLLVALAIALLLAIFYLLTRRWFWILICGCGILLSLLSALAAVVHWQVFLAFGFIVLAAMCYMAVCLLVD